MTRDQKIDVMSELDKLELYLKEKNIPYEREDRKPMKDEHGRIISLDWHQIGVPGLHPKVGKDYEWDVICHRGSYGYEQGLLEIAGYIVPYDAGNTVLGYLTADDVIKLIEEGRENGKSETDKRKQSKGKRNCSP